jgi:hypothetical protein
MFSRHLLAAVLFNVDYKSSLCIALIFAALFAADQGESFGCHSMVLPL